MCNPCPLPRQSQRIRDGAGGRRRSACSRHHHRLGRFRLLALLLLFCWSRNFSPHGVTAATAESDDDTTTDGGGSQDSRDKDDDDNDTTGTPAMASSGQHSLINATIPEAATSLRFPLHEKHGTQHVYLWIGQPAVRQTFIVDTGSRFMGTTCEGCTDCGTHTSPYLPQASSTRIIHQCDIQNENTSSQEEDEDDDDKKSHRRRLHLRANNSHNQNSKDDTTTTASFSSSHNNNFALGCRMAQECTETGNQCLISQGYTEGSTWQAIEVNDLVAFGRNATTSKDESIWDAVVAYSFGCQTKVKGLFKEQYADGILGLLRTEHSIVKAMATQKILLTESFSLCLHKAGGWIALGGAQTDRHLETMQFTPIVPAAHTHPWYAVGVTQVWMEDILLTANDGTTNPHILEAFHGGRGTVLDSGTTDLYLPAILEPVMTKLWKDRTGHTWSKPRWQKYTYEAFLALPSFHFVLQGNVTLTLEPKYYMDYDGTIDRPWNGTKSLTNLIRTEEETGAVLGFNGMMGYDFYYQDAYVGIARADCERGFVWPEDVDHDD